MSSVDDIIRDIQRKSDIAITDNINSEIAAHISAMGLNLAFFVFQNSTHSASARSLADGSHKTFPSITLFLKYDEDYRQTGIDPNRGNWCDEWEHTDIVRGVVNTVLKKHGYGSDYVTDHSFVFLDSLERIVLDQIGRSSKDAIRNLLCDEIPGIEPRYIFWSSSRMYYIILRDEQDYLHVNEAVKSHISQEVPKILAAADTGHFCQNYQVDVEWAYVGMEGLNLYGLSRED